MVSAVVNYTKKPNEVRLPVTIDKIKEVNPIWLLTGVSDKENNYAPRIWIPYWDSYKSIVRKEFEELSENILQKLSNI